MNLTWITAVAFCSSFKTLFQLFRPKFVFCSPLHRLLCLLTIKIFVDLFKTPLFFVKSQAFIYKEQNLLLENLKAGEGFLQHLSLRQKIKPLLDKGRTHEMPCWKIVPWWGIPLTIVVNAALIYIPRREIEFKIWILMRLNSRIIGVN